MALSDMSPSRRPLQEMFSESAAPAPKREPRGATLLNWVLHRDLFMDLLVFLDATVVALSCLLAALVATSLGAPMPLVWAGALGTTVISSLCFVTFIFLLKGYRRHYELNAITVARTSAKALIGTFAVLAGLHVLVSPDFQLLNVAFAGALAGAAAVSGGLRFALAKQISHAFCASKLQPRRIAIIGDVEAVGRFLNTMPIWRWGYDMVGYFADTPSEDDGQSTTPGIVDLIARARSEPIDDILIATADHDQYRLERMIKQLCVLPVRIYATPSLAVMSLKGTRPAEIGGRHLIEVLRPGIYGRRYYVKRALDLAVALAILPFFAVLFPIIALIIRLDSKGPVLFCQSRQGYNDAVFQIYKFRTMTVQENGNDVQQVTRHDPRVTRVGRLLRKLSLDELPQLLNVLKGDMSIVGPRPHVVKQNSYYGTVIDRYARRHTVLPGITGWAQISGFRGETKEDVTMAERIKYDLHYVENWSLGLDFYILFRTLFVFFSKNAY